MAYVTKNKINWFFRFTPQTTDNSQRINGAVSRSQKHLHYSDVIMGAMAPQIASLTIVYWTVYSGVNQRKHQSSASLAFLRGSHRGPVNSPHKWPVYKRGIYFHVMMSWCSSDLVMSGNRGISYLNCLLLCNLTGTSTAMLPRRLSNFRAIG